MNWADGVILLVLVLSTLIGALRGATREVLGLLGWVLAFWVAFTFADSAAQVLSNHIHAASVRKAVAWGGLFLLTLMLAAFATFFLASMAREGKAASVDRTLGGGYGVLRGLILVAILLMLAETTPAKRERWYRESFCITYLSWSADAVRAVTPKRWLAWLDRKEDEPSPDDDALEPALGESRITPQSSN